jgi:hypothetical protein
MSAHELAEWAVFEGEFGPLTLHERMDQLVGHVTGNPVEWRRQAQWSSDVDWLTLLAQKGGR